MSFQYEDVILPNRPVVLINRGWRVSDSNSRLQTKPSLSMTGGGTFDTFKIERPPEVQQCRKRAKAVTRKKPTVAPTRPRTEQSQRGLSRSTRRSGSNTSEGRSTPSRSSPGDDPLRPLLSARHFEDADIVRERLRREYSPTPRADARLVRLCTFEVPDFIARLHYLDYYVDRIGTLLYPLTGRYTIHPIREVWLPIILSDETWFYTILYSVARHLTAMDQHRNNQDVVYLADTVIRRIRTLLMGTARGEKPTDTFCCAVACMVAIEQNFGTPESVFSHARGLAEIVKVRGGVESINSLVRTKVWRADIEGAIDNLKKPLLPAPSKSELDLVAPSYLLPVPDYMRHSAYGPILQYLHPQLATVATELLNFTTFLDEHTKAGQLLEPFKLDNDVLILEHRLCICEQDEFSDLDQAFRIACLIFLKCLMRPAQNIPLSSSRIVMRLNSHIENIPTSAPQPLMLWILFMCMLAGGWLSPTRMDITERIISDTRRDDGSMPLWTEIRKRLKQIVWIDELYDRTGERLWSEVESIASAS